MSRPAGERGSPLLGRRASTLEPAPISWLMEQALGVPGILSLAAGFVDSETLPHAELAPLVQTMLGDAAQWPRALQYGTTSGETELRAVLLERLADGSASTLWEELGVEDVMVTAGSQQLLYHLAEVLLDPGDVVLVENPSYFVYVGALRSFGTRLVGLPVDDEGIEPAALDAALARLESEGELARTKMVYLMTYFQNPTGCSLSAERRGQVWQVLQRWFDRGLPAMIVEDAAYRGLRFPGVDDLPPLFEQQERPDRVVYIDSFSKVLSPGLRLGYGIVPRTIRDALGHLKGHLDFGSSRFIQMLVLSALRSGLCDRHVERLRRRYLDKATVLRDVLKDGLGDRIRFVEPRGGLYLWATLTEGIETGRGGPLFDAAIAEGVLYVPSDVCSVETIDGEASLRHAMRLCYSYPSDDDLVEAGRRLVRAVRAVSATAKTAGAAR